MKYLRTLLGSAWVIIFFFLSLFISILLFNRDLPLWFVRKVWAPIFIFLTGMKLKVEGLENLPKSTQTAIYFANHQSFLDIPVVQILVPTNVSFVLKKELKNFPFIGWWSNYAKMVFIDRTNKVKSDESLLKIAAQIQQGKNIAIFPEGTRCTDGKIGKIKLGGIYLASQSGAPIVPMLIEGTQKLMPKYSNILDGGPVQVKIGKPFYIPAILTNSDAELWQEKVRIYMQDIKDEIDYAQK